jgi:hypothetical protein
MQDFHDYLLVGLRVDFLSKSFEIVLQDVSARLDSERSAYTIKGQGLHSLSGTIDVDELSDHVQSGTVSWIKDFEDRKKLVIFLVSGTLEMGYTKYEVT